MNKFSFSFFTIQDFLDLKKVNNGFVNVNSQVDELPMSPNDSTTIFTPRGTSNAGNALNGPVELGTSGIRPRPTSLNLPSNHVHLRDESAPSKSEHQESYLIPCVAEHERYPNGGKESRTLTASRNGGSVTKEEAVLSRPSEIQTQQCDQPVCRDCCKSLSVMENKLENLSSCLERLETKLSADVEAIFELLRAHKEAIRGRKLDFHTQV